MIHGFKRYWGLVWNRKKNSNTYSNISSIFTFISAESHQSSFSSLVQFVLHSGSHQKRTKQEFLKRLSEINSRAVRWWSDLDRTQLLEQTVHFRSKPAAICLPWDYTAFQKRRAACWIFLLSLVTSRSFVGIFLRVKFQVLTGLVLLHFGFTLEPFEKRRFPSHWATDRCWSNIRKQNQRKQMTFWKHYDKMKMTSLGIFPHWPSEEQFRKSGQ